MIDEYKALLAAKSATLPDGYDEVQAAADAARAALERHPGRRSRRAIATRCARTSSTPATRCT